MVYFHDVGVSATSRLEAHSCLLNAIAELKCTTARSAVSVIVPSRAYSSLPNNGDVITVSVEYRQDDSIVNVVFYRYIIMVKSSKKEAPDD